MAGALAPARASETMTTVASNARTALTPEQLETHAALHRLRQGLDARLGRATKLTGLRCQPLALTGNRLRFLHVSPTSRAAAAVGQPVQRELGETEPLAGEGSAADMHVLEQGEFE